MSKKKKQRQPQQFQTPGQGHSIPLANCGWLRNPIISPIHRLLCVLIYARYSTDEQNPRSIADQVNSVKRFLAQVYDGEIQFTVLFDEGISGEIVSRPGIDQVAAGIASRKWDLIIGEDASRFYRNETAGIELVESAVDEGIRFICLGDRIDTSEQEEWEDRLHEALRHHAKCNLYTSRRIKRALEALWLMGAAIGPLHTGYTRDPSIPATEHDPAEGPFFDKIDPSWTGIIKELFERVARQDPLWQILPWLNQSGLPKSPNAQRIDWSDDNIIALIRQKVYKGVEEYRNTISKKRYRTGKRTPERNKPEEVLVRNMPHLRIVPDLLWIEANRAIDARTTQPNPPIGKDHPLYNIPRDSRGPLAGILVCGFCGGKLHVSGRNEGGYQCANAHRHACWNKATTLRSVAHLRIADAILEQLPVIKIRLEEIIGNAGGLLIQDESRQTRQQLLRTQIHNRTEVIGRIVAAIESSDESPVQLVQRLTALEHEQACDEAQLGQLEAETASMPSREEFADTLREFAEAVQKMDRETRPTLSRVVSAIRVIPFQQFGSSKVVLRARFEIAVSGFLPYAVLSLLRTVYGDSLDERLGTIPITVDLFDMSIGPHYGIEALKIHEASKGSLKAIEVKLKINKREANIAVNYGRMLREAGLEDPYIEMTGPPADPGRWRYREDHAPPAA